MRSILMTVMLIIVTIVIYNGTVGGEEGAKKQLKESGVRMNLTIERINLYGQDL